MRTGLASPQATAQLTVPSPNEGTQKGKEGTQTGKEGEPKGGTDDRDKRLRTTMGPGGRPDG